MAAPDISTAALKACTNADAPLVQTPASAPPKACVPFHHHKDSSGLAAISSTAAANARQAARQSD